MLTSFPDALVCLSPLGLGLGFAGSGLFGVVDSCVCLMTIVVIGVSLIESHRKCGSTSVSS